MSAIGHNNPPSDIDGYDDFDVDYARALHWAAMDADNNLTTDERHFAHVIATLMPKDGSGVRPSYSFIARSTGLSVDQVKRRMGGILKWDKIKVTPSSGRRPHTYETNISKAEALTAWCEAKRKKDAIKNVAVHLERTAKPVEGQLERTTTGNTALAVQSEHTTNDSGAGSPPVVVRQNPVVVHPECTQLLDSKKIDRSAGASGAGSEPKSVIPISANVAANAAINKRREKVFGPGLMSSAERLASFLQVGCPEALDLMDAHQGSVSPGVVLNAIAKLDLRGLDRNGLPIKGRKKWFEIGIGFAKADANGDWLEAPKVAGDPKPSQPYNSDVDENAASTKKLDAALALVRKQDGIR